MSGSERRPSEKNRTIRAESSQGTRDIIDTHFADHLSGDKEDKQRTRGKTARFERLGGDSIFPRSNTFSLRQTQIRGRCLNKERKEEEDKKQKRPEVR